MVRQRSLKVFQRDLYNAGEAVEVTNSLIQIFQDNQMHQYDILVRASDEILPTKKKRHDQSKVYCAFQSFNIASSSTTAQIGELYLRNAVVDQFYQITSIYSSVQGNIDAKINSRYCDPVLYTHLSSYPPYAEETLEDIVLTPTNLSPLNFVDSEKDIVFTWDYDRKDIIGEDGLERSQKSAVIEWKGPDQQIHTVNALGTLTSHTFSKNTFPKKSSFDWRIKIISDDDVESEFSSWITVSTTDVAGIVRALSPDIAIVDADVDNRISWIYSNPYGTDPSGYEIEMSINGGVSWKQIKKAVTSDCYTDVPAGTFSAGNVQYRVRAFSQSGIASEWAVASITVRARPAPPSIYQIDADSDRPMIYWESTGQETYEIKILDLNSIVLYSYYAPLPDRMHRIPKRLDNAQYTVSVKIWNEYGLDSSEARRQFVISANKPAVPSIIGTAFSTYNRLTFTFETDRAVLLRNGTAIADISGQSSYDDRTAPYRSEYCVRALSDKAFCDSKPIVLERLNQQATMTLADDHNVYVVFIYKQGSSPEKSSTVSGEYGLMQFSGRKKPVVEYGDQITRTKSLSYSLRNIDDLKLLASMAGKTVIWNDRLDHMVACITGLSWNEHRGYIDVSFSLTEVDGQEEIDYE